MKKTEAGQALPLTLMLALMVLVAAGAVLGMVHNVLADQARAQTAADAAALAAAASDGRAARLAAEANGARLLRLTHPDGDAEVTVKFGNSEAKARARLGRQ